MFLRLSKRDANLSVEEDRANKKHDLKPEQDRWRQLIHGYCLIFLLKEDRYGSHDWKAHDNGHISHDHALANQRQGVLELLCAVIKHVKVQLKPKMVAIEKKNYGFYRLPGEEKSKADD